MTDHLFDPEPFTRGDPKVIRMKASREVVLEPIGEGWSIVATRLGPEPFQHHLKAELGHGSIVTDCGVVGYPLSVDIDLAQRCPFCARA